MTSHSDGGRRGQLSSSGLRPGWTTGACATAAARAAYAAWLTGEFPDPVIVSLPHGRTPAFALTDEALGRAGDDWAAMAAVTKDAGDDPDLTHGAVVRAWVGPGMPGTGVTFAAGPGVGTITLPGLPLPVGEASINPMPRQMITDNLHAEADGIRARRTPLAGSLTEPPADVLVRIGIDRGEEMAPHTLNPRLGIMGGLSVLGTTGVVVPYSCSAWIDSIRRGIDVALAAGERHLAACTGSTSERVAAEILGLAPVALLDMGDFAGAVLKYLRRHPCERLTIVGGVGKISKLANGHLDLHSGRSSVDTGHLAELIAATGAPSDIQDAIRSSRTVLGAVDIAQRSGIPLADLISRTAREQALHILDGAPVDVAVVCIDRAGTVLGQADPGGVL